MTDDQITSIAAQFTGSMLSGKAVDYNAYLQTFGVFIKLLKERQEREDAARQGPQIRII